MKSISNRRAKLATVLILSLASGLQAGDAVKILFIGNSFTFGAGTKVQSYQSNTVTDLNKGNVGGVPALFKAFSVQAGLDYQVFVETVGGKGLDFHVKEKAELIGKPWDVVCMHGYSTMDQKKPGEPALLVSSAGEIAKLLHDKNPKVSLYLTATWARADLIYPAGKRWSGKDVKTMTQDIRQGYDKAAAACALIKGVVPVGEAWQRAIEKGLADANPYDGIEAGKFDLWGKDHYHGSAHGYYLEALTVFAVVTGRDPRTLGEKETAARDLGISPAEASALQQVAYEQTAVGK